MWICVCVCARAHVRLLVAFSLFLWDAADGWPHYFGAARKFLWDRFTLYGTPVSLA